MYSYFLTSPLQSLQSKTASGIAQASGKLCGLRSWLWPIEMAASKMSIYKKHRLIWPNLPEHICFRKLLFERAYARRNSKVSGMAVRLSPAAARNAMRNPKKSDKSPIKDGAKKNPANPRTATREIASVRRWSGTFFPTNAKPKGPTTEIPRPKIPNPIAAQNGVRAKAAKVPPAAATHVASMMTLVSEKICETAWPENRPIAMVRPSIAGPIAPSAARPWRLRSMYKADQVSTVASVIKATKTINPHKTIGFIG